MFSFELVPDLLETEKAALHTTQSRLVFTLAAFSAALFPALNAANVNRAHDRVVRNTQKWVFRTVGRNWKLSIVAKIVRLRFICIILYYSGRAQTWKEIQICKIVPGGHTTECFVSWQNDGLNLQTKAYVLPALLQPMKRDLSFSPLSTRFCIFTKVRCFLPKLFRFAGKTPRNSCSRACMSPTNCPFSANDTSVAFWGRNSFELCYSNDRRNV